MTNTTPEAMLRRAPGDWSRSKLGFEATVKARLGWRGLKAEEYVQEGVAFLSTPDIKTRMIDFPSVNRITEERYAESPEIALQPDDVLLVKDGSTLGIVHHVRDLPERATVNGSIAVIRTHQSLEGAFLRYYLESWPFQYFVHLMKDGMGVPHLFQRDLRWFDVLVPPLPTQRAIAEFLDRKTAAIDDLIAKKERLLALLAEKRASLIHRAVTKGLDPSVPMKDSGVPWIGEIPAHWEVKRLKFTCRLESGHTPSRSEPSYWVDDECTIPWVSLNDTKTLKANAYISDTTVKISSRGMANSSAHLIEAGAVVFTRDATIGLTAITTRPMAVSQHIIAWVCRPGLSNLYLLRVIGAMTQELDRLTFGATIKTIGMGDVKELVTPVPPQGEQVQIVAALDHSTACVDEAVARIAEQIERLREYRQALITAAVTGQLDIEAAQADALGHTAPLLAADTLEALP